MSCSVTETRLSSGFRARFLWAPVAAIAATYFFFLIFAEFAFLELVQRAMEGPTTLRGILAALGVSGVAGGITAAWFLRICSPLREEREGVWLRWSFRGCATGGVLALVDGAPSVLTAAAVFAGGSLGALTVTLAATLRSALGDARLGWGIGLGTGAAYAVSNLPWVFRAGPVVQTILAVTAVLAASFLPSFKIKTTQHSEGGSTHLRDGALARWVAVFAALVWLDSAAFYIIQHNHVLRSSTWAGEATLLGNAAIHLLAAVLSGVWLDRGHRGVVVALAGASLGTAALVLNGTLPGWLPAHGLYTAGVSFYSVALVEYPARRGDPRVGAWVFSLAGWLGSALGIGMAQDLGGIPTAFVVGAGALGLATLVGRRRLAASVGVLMIVGSFSSVRGDEVSLGREVYIAEGCLHCHSQFIRPHVSEEVLNWGPATPLSDALNAQPPLFGTRRQGPDLSHVGNRRSPEWNRLHLMAPATISPGSRMPSYAHLFADDDPRGPALVSYLASLGSDTFVQRQEQATRWKPLGCEEVSFGQSARLFARLCTQCHGPQGRGDGVLASGLSLRPPDWTTGTWRRAMAGENLELSLARIIKFGLPGTPMAGHEYLPDREILGLAKHVRSLQKEGSSTQSAVQP